MSGEADKLRVADQYFSIEPYAQALRRGDSDFRLAADRALSDVFQLGRDRDLLCNRFWRNTPPTETLHTLYVISALPE